MLEVEGRRAIIYGLGKRRWAVPARFPQLRGRQTRMRKHQQVNYEINIEMCKAFQIYDNLSQIDDNLEKFAFNSQISR